MKHLCNHPVDYSFYSWKSDVQHSCFGHAVPTLIVLPCLKCGRIGELPCLLCDWPRDSKAKESFKKRFKNVKEI